VEEVKHSCDADWVEVFNDFVGNRSDFDLVLINSLPGILVPTYILIMELPVKYAISLTSVTVLGGAVANSLYVYFR
jgi:hypothetical protein